MLFSILSVSSNGPWSLSWEPSGQTFQPLEVYPNTTTTYIASITDANNCVSTDTLVLDVLCSNETLVDFEPFTVENEIHALFPNLPSYHTNLYEGCNNAKIIFSEGYQFTSDENYFAFLNILKGCNPEVKFALSLSDPGVVDAFRDRFKEVISIRNIDYLFCNQEEAVALAGQDFKEELKKIAQNFVVTNGSENSTIFENNRFYDLDAYKVEAIDSNGAGDIFAGATLFKVN